MALQFDGSGFVLLDQGFTLRPDMMWRLSFQAEYDDGSFFFAGNANDGGPYIGFTNGGIAIRVGTVIKVNHTFTPGQSYNIEIYCNGSGMVTVELVGIASATGIQNNNSTFNMFGKYFNEGFQGALIYAGILSGVFRVENAVEGNREYDFEQLQGTQTLPDNEGEDLGQLLNFVSGGYTEPAQQNQPPSITILGNSTVTINVGDTYVDAGATAIDPEDGVVTSSIQVVSNVNTQVPGQYTVTYSVTDSDGATTTAIRTVEVVDVVNEPPVIVLEGLNPYTMFVGDTYIEPGYSASDVEDGDLTGDVEVFDNIDNLTPGVYLVDYSVTDNNGNTTFATRAVIVAERPSFVYDFNQAANSVFFDFKVQSVEV